MLDQADGHSSRALTGEDRRMAKKSKNAARQAFISMQTPTPKRNGKKQQKLMHGEGFMKLKSKKSSSGIQFVYHCQMFTWGCNSK